MAANPQPSALLRVPPFPASKPGLFAAQAKNDGERMDDCEIDSVIASLRSARVGGDYWGHQPPLPADGYTLVKVRNAHSSASPLRKPRSQQDRVRITGDTVEVMSEGCDPWHLLGGAALVVADSDDELALLAAIAGLPLECVGPGRFARLSGETPNVPELREIIRSYVVGAFTYFDPFSGVEIGFARAIEQCAFWRKLIDGNRDIRRAVGFALWKRATVAPLLWRGSNPMLFRSSTTGLASGDRVAIWKARAGTGVIADLERRGVEMVEVEDGFIRSAGLGADCVPPLSIIVDRLGAHFDPSRPSELELLIEEGGFTADLLQRAQLLRRLIVESGISKYSAEQKRLTRRDPDRLHILVPGQVEDDRAVTTGGGGLTSNLELLRRVRAIAPGAYLLYKPHPDVEAGHRLGGIPDDLCLAIADEVVRDEPVSALLDLVDEVHVNTSLAGFEALLRNKPVTTHGIPFYAGWGLTRDLGAVPSRRSRKCTLDELVAAVLLLYPRYLDPMTGLPCPPEILIRRLSEPQQVPVESVLVKLRRLQGRCRRGLSAVAGW